jgi:anti-sigma factor RsiW
MLSDRWRTLLAGYVDGELNSRQRKGVLRLLGHSPEARALLQQLQEDAEALRRLPRRHLDRDLSQPVLQIIAERKLRPGRHRRRPVERPSVNLPAWAGFGAAAAALLLVALGSFFYFSAAMQAPDDGSVAARKEPPERPARPKGTGERDPQVARATPPGKGPAKAEPVRSEGPELVPAPQLADRAPQTQEDNKPPREPVEVTAPVERLEVFRVADIRLSLFLKPGELEQEAGRQKLLKQLERPGAFRVEAACHDSVKMIERAQAALKAGGINLVIDQAAQARMRARARLKVKTHFVLYLEDVMPEELLQVLRQARGPQKEASPFEAVIFNAMTDADREELCKLLGVKGKRLPEPPAAGPLGVDVRRPLAEQTGDQVAKALTGGALRSEPGKTAERLALLMPYNPVRPRPDSVEIKRFLDGRKPPRPGAVQILLVLRETKI